MAVNTITYANKVNLNENSGIAEINKITDANMNEIKSVVNNNATELSNLKPVLLWTNPNPTSSFASQTITLSSNDYDMLKVIYLYNLTSGLAGAQELYKGYGTRISYISSGNTPVQRTLTRNSDTSFVLSSTSGASTDDNNIVPLYIIGYKTGLF